MLMLPTGTSINRSGFTLVELLVVIVLLSLVSFISIPLMSNLGDGADHLMVRKIAGTVKQLYNEATLTKDEHLLTFDFSRNSMSAFRLRSAAATIEKEPFGREVILAPLQVKQIDIEGKGSFRSGQVSIRIFPLGWMESTHMLVPNENGNEMQLVFSPLTGSVTIDAEHAPVQ